MDDKGKNLLWNGGEKFYYYKEWLRYMIKNFFEPIGVKLNGTVKWQGEDPDDNGVMVVDDSVLSIFNSLDDYKDYINQKKNIELISNL